MADNTSVLGQEPIVPENITAPTTDGVSTTNYNNLDLKSRFAKIKAMDEGLPSARTVDLPVSSQKLEKRLGEFTPVEGVDIMENLAQDQSGMEQLAYLPLRALAKAATETAKIPGFMAGLTEWVSTGLDPKEYGNAFNNAWITSLDKFNADLQQNGLPVYSPKSVQNGDIFDKLGSTSFWATEGADGVGFLLGMMVPGMALRYLKAGDQFASIVSGIQKLLKPGTSAELIASSTKVAGLFDDVASAIVNTGYEAGIEGQQVFNDYLKDHPDDIQGAGDAASKTFKNNLGILIGPNLLAQKWLFGGFKRTMQTGKSVGTAFGREEVIAKGIGKAMAGAEKIGELGKVVAPTLLKKAGKIAIRFGEGVLSEGFFEEGMQQATSEGAKKGIDVKNPIELLKEYISQVTANTKGNTEMWSGIIIGGLMGGGMSLYHGTKQAGREQKAISEYHNLLNNNYINQNKVLRDYELKNEDGSTVYESDGVTPKLDIARVMAGGASVIKNDRLRSMAEEAWKNNDEDAYDQISNMVHFDYMLPWLQIEGGAKLLKEHVKAMARNVAENDTKIKGQADEVSKIEKTLLNKVDGFQDIYNKINDTHDISIKNANLRSDDKSYVKSFGDQIKSNKMSSKVQMDNSARRIEDIKNSLSKYGISSSETKYNQNLVTQLSESYKNKVKEDNIDKIEQAKIEKDLAYLNRHVNIYDLSQKQLNNYFDKKYLKTAFDDHVATIKSAQAKFESEKAVNIIKQNIDKIKDEGLKVLYSDSYEDNTDIASNRKLIKIKYKDSNGNIITSIARIGDPNSDGNLDITLLNRDPETKVLTPDKTASLQSNKSILFQGSSTPTDIELASYLEGEDIDDGEFGDISVELFLDYASFFNDTKSSIEFEEEAKHQYLNQYSLLTLSSNQLYTDSNPNVARWFVFVNNHVYTKTPDGKKLKYALKTFHFKQMEKESDYLKYNLSFFVGDGKTKTYNQIVKDNIELEITNANDDIKTVVIDNVSNKLAMFSEYGDPSDTGKYIIHTSLSLPTSTYNFGKHKGEDRYSGKRLINAYMVKNSVNEATARKWFDSYVMAGINSYKLFRKKTEEGSIKIKIDGINPGVRVTKPTEPVNVIDGVVSDINDLYIYVSSPSIKFDENGKKILSTITHNYAGNDHVLKSGVAYVFNQGVFEPIKPATLMGTESVGDVLNLLRFVASNKERSSEVLAYLKNVLHMTTDNEAYKLYFIYDKKTNNIDALRYGDKKIKAIDLVDNKGVEELIEFLKNKQWNINRKLLEDSNPFYELGVNNSLELTKPTTYQSYKHFLFDTSNNNKSKGTINVHAVPKGENGKWLLAQKDGAQYFNQSIRTSTAGWELPKKKENKEEKLPDINSLIGSGKKEVSKPVEKKPTKKEESLPDINSLIGSGKKETINIYAGTNENIDLSNFALRPFIIDGERFNTVEGAFQAYKFGDTAPIQDNYKEVIEKLKIASGAQAKIIGKTIKNLNTKEWNNRSSIVMKSLLLESFRQNPHALGRLLSTGDAIFTHTQDKSKWGSEFPRLLMEVRGELLQTKQINITQESVWSDIEKDDSEKSYYLDLANGDLTQAKKLAFEDRNKDSKGRRITKDTYKKENIENAVKWAKSKFPNFPIEVVDGVIKDSDGKRLWGQLLRGSKILISNLAEEGTIYHEAWHVWDELINTPEGRIILYDEVRRRLSNKDITDKEAKEFIAEEFRDFMMMGKDYRFNKGEEVKKSLFKKIYNAIKELFSKLFGVDISTLRPNQIENAFNTINEGTFIDIINKNIDSFGRIEGISPVRKLDFVQDINYNFFKFLVEDTIDKGGDLVFKLEQSPGMLYRRLYVYYKNQVRDGKNDFKDVVDKWDDFVYQHKLFLTQYKIDIRNSEEKSRYSDPEYSDDDMIEGRNSENYKESFTRPISDDIPSSLRLLIGSLQSINTETKQPILKPLTDGNVFTRSNVEYHKTINILLSNLSMITTPKSMMEKLTSLTVDHPEFNNLITYIGGNADAGTMSATQARLHMQFFNTFATNKNKSSLVTFKNDGVYTYADLVDESFIRVTQRDWISNAQKLADDNKSKYISKSNDYRINIDALLKDLNNTKNYAPILREIGMQFNKSDEEVNFNTEVNNYVNRLKDELRRLKTDVSVNDLYNRDKVQNQSEMDAMATYATEDIINDSDLMFFNQDGNVEWVITRNSHVTVIKNMLNEYSDMKRVDKNTPVPEYLQFLMPYDGFKGSLYNMHSLYWQAIESGLKFKFGPLKAIANQSGDAIEMSKTNVADYKAATFDSILNNKIPFRRAADRGPEYVIELLKANFFITKEAMIDRMSNYFKDELITSVALITEQRNKKSTKFGSNLKNYSVNARNLSNFSFIFETRYNDGVKMPTPVEFMKDRTLDDITLDGLNSLVKDYIELHGDDLYKIFDKYIEESVIDNIHSLTESGLIHKKGDKYDVLFNPETLASAKVYVDTSNRITNDELNRLMRIHFINWFTGMQEQSKMFIGDVAHYKSVSDYTKRTTSLVSTFVRVANDDKTRQLLDIYHPNVNGNKHSDVINMVIIPEVKVDASNDLVTSNSSYLGMKVADGQMYAINDFIRNVHARNGKWSDEQERSYQYEMQSLVLKVLADSKLNAIWSNANESMFTTGVFSKHTNGKKPSSPMFNGEVIDPYDNKLMGQMPALKPLGAGYLKNDHNLGANNITKQSTTAPVLSELEGDGLNIYLSMLQNNIDVFGDETTQKADYLLNNIDIENGEYITQDSNVTKLSYDDYGLQNEIHTEEKGKVTDSTQKVTCIYYDVYDHGVIRKGMEGLADNIIKRDEILTEINNRNLKYVVRELGLTVDEKGFYHLTDENKDKFKKLLLEMFVQRLMPDNVIDGLSYVLDSKQKVLDLFTNSDKIEEVLNAFVKNNVIRRKVNGNMLVQESNYIYSKKLKFYQRGENGEKTSRAEVMIPLPEEWNSWVKSLGGLEKFNKMVSEGKIDKGLIEFTANRIPTVDLNTIEAFTVAKFLPTHYGARIILPYEIVAKTSSDFDIDKLTSYFNNFRIINGRPVPVKFTDNEESLPDRWAEYVADATNRRNELIYSLYDTSAETRLINDLLLHDYEKIAKENGLMSMEEFGKLPIMEQQPTSVLENMMNDLHAEAILHPMRYDQLTHPHEAVDLKKMASEFYTPISYIDMLEKSDSDKTHVLNQWWFNNRVAEKNWDGKQSLGAYAASNVVNAMTQRFPIKVTDEFINNGMLFFKGQEGGQYSNGHLMDHNRKLVSDNYGQSTVASVDVAKDPFANKLNMSLDTVGVWSFLNTTGIDNSVGIRQIAAMMTHPIVVEYMRMMDVSRSMIARNNVYTKDKGPVWDRNNWFETNIRWENKIVEDLIDKYWDRKVDEKDSNKMVKVTNRSLPVRYDDMLVSKYRDWNASKRSLRRDQDKMNKFMAGTNRLLEKLNYKYLDVNDIHNSKSGAIAIQVLDNFLMYKEAAWKHVSLNSSLRPYAYNNFGKNLNANSLRIRKLDNVKKDGFYDVDDINNHINNSFIKSALNPYYETIKLFNWTSLARKYPEIAEFYHQHVVRNYEDKRFDDADKAMKLARNKFLSFVFSYRFFSGNSDMTELQNKYRDMFIGENSMARRLDKMKGKISNESLNILRPVVKEYSAELGKNRQNDYITTFNKQYGINDQNMYVAILEDLFSSKDPDVALFARDFIDYAMFQNGIGNSPISFMKIIPNSVFIPYMDDIMDRFIDSFYGLSEKEQELLFDSFSKQFVMNNFKNKNIVYRDKETISEDDIPIGRSLIDSFGVITVGTRSRAAKENYISRRYYTTSRKERAKTKEKKLRPSQRYLLYENMGENNGKVQFKLIETLGDGMRANEYYPVANIDAISSIFNDNINTNIKTSNIEDTVKKPNDEGLPNILDIIGNKLQIDDYDQSKPNKEIDDSMDNFLNTIGVTTKIVNVVKNKFGDILPAIAISRLSEMTIDVIENRKNLTTMPEETAHFYVSLLDENGGLYKSMYNQIINYSVYSKVVEQYGDIYQNNEKQLREEAIGKLIADRIINGIDTSLNTRQKDQVNNWWNKLWSTIKEIFSKTKSDPYTKAAYDIFTTNVDRLKIPTTDVSQSEMKKDVAQLSTDDLIGKWNDIPSISKGIYKYMYYKTIDEAQRAFNGYVNEFGENSVSYISISDNKYRAKIAIKKPMTKTDISETIIAKEDVGMSNLKELTKAPVDLNAEQMVINFDTYFPGDEYLEDSEKQGEMKAIENGEISIICAF